MSLRIAALLLIAACIDPARAQESLLARMTGTWDVRQRMWPGPGAAPVALPAAVAERRLIGERYLEEVMQPADAPAAQGGTFTRHAMLNHNPVTSRYEYSSLDTRAPQLMVETSPPMQGRGRPAELKLQGGTFVAPEWGTAKNVRFKYRLTIGDVDAGRQTVRLFLTPQTVLPKIEFLAFDYVYSKRP